MTALNHLYCALIVLFLCTLPIESVRHRENKERKSKHRDPSPLASQHHIIESKVTPINLCSKERDMKLVCHCSPDNENSKADKAECWVFNPELTVHDLVWTAFHTQTQLKSLGFSVHGLGNLSFIPSDTIQTLKHLEKLTIEYAQIVEVPSFIFGNFTRLRNITLARNQIRMINPYAFAHHERLEDLILTSNDIFEVDQAAFIGLINLQRLSLARNRLQVIHEETFEPLENLGELFLNFNLIDSVSREAFKGLANLWNLKLDYNKLKFIEEETFAELLSLIELDLGHNMIETISERAFDGLNNLKRLDLGNNRLKTLERGLFATIPTLTYLNLMRNSLETLTLLTIQPLMNNLVNHTSLLLIKDNELVCDCRLGWIFDLRNRTRNFELKYSLGEIECKFKSKDKSGRMKVVVDQHLTDDEADYSDDESYEERPRPVNLLQMTQRELPCPQQYREHVEHPSTREFIGFNLGSWMNSSAERNYVNFIQFLVFLCTTLAFIH